MPLQTPGTSPIAPYCSKHQYITPVPSSQSDIGSPAAVGKRLLEFQTEVELRFGEIQTSHTRLEGQIGEVQGTVGEVRNPQNPGVETLHGHVREVQGTAGEVGCSERHAAKHQPRKLRA